MPVFLRLAAAALIAGALFRSARDAPAPGVFFAGGELASAQAVASLLGIIELVVLVFLVIGAAGRLSSIAGLCLVGAHQVFSSLTIDQILLVGLYTAILYLGTGAFSLWTPEDRLIFYRAGERGRYADTSQNRQAAAVELSQAGSAINVET
jgi:hypothetical protein